MTSLRAGVQVAPSPLSSGGLPLWERGTWGGESAGRGGADSSAALRKRVASPLHLALHDLGVQDPRENRDQLAAVGGKHLQR